MIFENHIDEQENNDKTVFILVISVFITWIIENNQQTEAKSSRSVNDLLIAWLKINVKSYMIAIYDQYLRINVSQ